MEGASWVAKKGQTESQKFASKLYNLASEFDNRALNCITSKEHNEVDGLKFNDLADWVSQAMILEGNEAKGRFDTMLENINYHLSEANKQFGV